MHETYVPNMWLWIEVIIFSYGSLLSTSFLYKKLEFVVEIVMVHQYVLILCIYFLCIVRKYLDCKYNQITVWVYVVFTYFIKLDSFFNTLFFSYVLLPFIMVI